jgi:hypothetical protein
VTGDFTSEGLDSDVSALSENELLSINDWIAFYEKEYKFVGVLAGIYYDHKGRPTELLLEVGIKFKNNFNKKNNLKRYKTKLRMPNC